MLSLCNKKWILAKPPHDVCKRLSEAFDISPLLAQLLVNRNITTRESGQYLLQNDLQLAHDPFLMLGMDKAVRRIVTAIHNKESITLYGDYDVDGVTSTALMVHFFRDLGVHLEHYLPNRMEEGYGVNEAALEKIQARGGKLVITADCGITAVRQVKFAQSIGLDVIITDHHQVGEDGLPPALAVLNPHQPGCTYPFKFLAGVGIVFKLAVGIRRGLLAAGWDPDRLPNLERHLDLFAVGTIADMAPLTGENHVLTARGLEALRTTAKPGLVALKSVVGLDGRIDAASIGFGLGPRLNAAGRLGQADRGLHLLVSDDLNQAVELAEKLNQLNEERKETQQWAQKEAEYLLDRQVDLAKDRVIVLASENFHQGVIGIVAAKLAEKYYRPTFLIALKNGIGKGSARSIPAFNLFKAMVQCSEHLIEYGGHAYAAGLNIEEHKVQKFREALNEVGRQFLTPEHLIPEITIDAALLLKDITSDFFNEVQKLEPFGQLNTKPVFISRQVEVRNFRTLGKQNLHVKFKAVQGPGSLEVIGFNLAPALDPALLDGPVDLVYELHLNDWNGRQKIELKLLDIRPSQK